MSAAASNKKELLYRRSEYLALRNEEDGYYLCQVLQHIYASTNKFKIQWLSERSQQADTYRPDYIDFSQPECIITHVKLNKLAKDVYSLPENQKKKVFKSLNEVLNPDDEEEEEGEEEAESEEGEESGEESDEAKQITFMELDLEELSDDEEEDEDWEIGQKDLDAAECDATCKEEVFSTDEVTYSSSSEEDGGPPAKKAKGLPPTKSKARPRPSATVSTKGKGAKKKVVVKKPALKRSASKQKEKKKKVEKAKKKKADKPEKPKKHRLTPEERANPNLLLTPNPKVKVWNKDPLIYSNEKVPFVSSTAHTKLAFRAVAMNDMKLLQSLIDNWKNIGHFSQAHSFVTRKNALHEAIKKENHKAIQLLVKDLFHRDNSKKPRCPPPRCLLDTINTGRYNRSSLGIRAVRKISMSRGCKEGNNALTKKNGAVNNQYYETCVSSGVSKKTLDVLCNAMGENTKHIYASKAIGTALKYGQRKLAASMIEIREKNNDNTFNKLAKEVLLFDTEPLTKTGLREVSVRKKSWDNQNVTPLHCAAINPNVKYLSTLLSVLPEYGITDKINRRPIHFAAACEGTGPLEYLLNKGADPDEADAQGYTPLMYACMTGRVHNVDLLLTRAKAKEAKKDNDDEEEDEDAEDEEDEDGPSKKNVPVDKYGIGGINRPNQNPRFLHSLCPIHLAIEADHKDVVACLIKHGVDVHKQLSASKDKKTPLIVAAAHGNLDIVKMLVAEKARVEQKDKLQKTALTYACMNGQAHIASYLLSLGADPNQADSSGNTCCHYAAAYGWFFGLKVLIDAGADPTISNDWKLSPLGIAFLKGHLGLVDFLLQQPGIDINFTNDQGMTLVALASSSSLMKGLSDEVSYLVDKKSADCRIKDVTGNSPLHHLAFNDIKDVPGGNFNPVLIKEATSESLKVANILLKGGCSAADANNEGFTPVMAAISVGNTDLVKLLMDKGGECSATTDNTGKNTLHLMAEKCMESNMAPLVELLDKSIKKGSKTGPNPLHKMGNVYSEDGMTPIHKACLAYMQWSGSPNRQSDSDDDGSEADEEEEEENEDENDTSDSGSDGGPPRGKKRKAGGRGLFGRSFAFGAFNNSNAKKAKVSGEDPSWEQGRKFIRCLLELCNADPCLPLVERTLAKGAKTPTKEADRYMRSDLAKWTALFFAIRSANEPGSKARKEVENDRSPIVTLILTRTKLAALNTRNLDGRTPLILAINTKRSGDARSDDVIKKLVKHGADVNMVSLNKEDENGASLILAVNHLRSVEIIKTLLSAKADVQAKSQVTNQTALHRAACIDRAQTDVLGVVKALVEAGAKVNVVDKKGRTPLHLAAACNYLWTDCTSEVESYLIDRGANVWQKDYRNRLPLHYVFTGVGNKYYETLKLDPIELCTTMTSYMSSRSIDVPDYKKMTPLHYAARAGASVCCTHLIQKKCDINLKDIRGNTPLTLSVIHQHETSAIMLIQKNADINLDAVIVPRPVGKKAKEDNDEDEESEQASDDDGSNPEERDTSKENHVDNDKEVDSEDESDGPLNLWQWKNWRQRPSEIRRFPVFQVCVKNEWAGVIFLMLDMLNTSFTMNNAIEAALNTGKYNLVLTLVRKVKNHKVLQESNPRTGRTLFHTLAVKSEPPNDKTSSLLLRVADVLRERGVPLNTADKYGCRPLHYAALMHNTTLVKYILENIDTDDVGSMRNASRITPLGAVFWKGGKSAKAICDLFQDVEVDLDEHYLYPDVPVSFGSRKTRGLPQDQLEADFIADHVGVRYTPLIRATQLQDFHVAKMLLKDGADPNMADSRQRSPLVHAIIRNDIHLVKLLLNHNYVMKADADKEQIVYDKDAATQGGLFGGRGGLFGGRGSLFGGKRRHWRGPRSAFGTTSRGGRRSFKLGRQNSADSSGNDNDSNEEDEEELPVKETTDINLKKYPTYKRVSSVMMNVKDEDGLTLVHHLVKPLKVGTFDNVAMLKILHDAGAPIAEKDNTGLTPLDYALSHNAPILAKALQKLMGIPLAKWSQPTVVSPSAVSDGLNWSPITSYNNDAESLLAKLEEDAMEVDEEEDKPEPDSHLDMSDTGEILKDEEQDVFYDVAMTKVDLKGNYGYGLYNFYIMQIVKHKGKDLWILFNRWGRIGDEGQYQRTPFSTRKDAEKEFAKIFRSKSGNAWDNVKRFEPKPKKYRILDLECRLKQKKQKVFELDLDTKSTSKLSDNLLKLMKSFTVETQLQSAFRDTEVATDLMPFGRIKKETIVKATAILSKIAPLVESIVKMREKTPVKDEELLLSKIEEAQVLSNEIHSLVPSSRYVNTPALPIVDKDTYETEMERLTSLAQLELASTILRGAMYRKKEMHPMDYVYRSIGTTLRLMNPDDTETQYMLKYIHSGLSVDGIDNREIQGIYEVNRPGEFQRVHKMQLENHKLLFHGTRTANMISILHRGLLIAPPGALITGHLYGKGIYTSDVFSKSASYCNNDDTKDNFVFICEVALGDSHCVQQPNQDDNDWKYISTVAPGEQGPQASYTVTLRDGATVPLGNLMERKAADNNSWWMPDYSEYIVFNADQIRLRYLVHFKL